MHPFPAGTKVQTSESYFKKFGRRVIGTSVEMNPFPLNHITVVKWEFQEGNIIPDHLGNKVMMMSKDLEVYQVQ